MALDRLVFALPTVQLALVKLTLKMLYTGRLCQREMLRTHYPPQIQKALKPRCAVSITLLKVKSFDSVCLPTHYELCVEVQKGLNKLARRFDIEFNHTERVNDLYRLVGKDLHHADGAQGTTMRWWRQI